MFVTPVGDPASVAEVQGLYGPFQFPELLLQRIWAEQLFERLNLCTAAGEKVKILRPGRWNRQGGPDFQQAEIEIAGQTRHGDVELHLREQDWGGHQHAVDPAYDDVILHVVLFPSKTKTSAGAGGQRIPIVSLLPYLWHDLEEYAADAAISAIAQRPADRLAQVWLELTAEQCRERIVIAARQRWRSKVHYARQRIDKLGWQSACHHTALEILGYRFNRAPMLAVATAHPLPEWVEGSIDLAHAWTEQGERWKLGAVRPANHPRRRLSAYANWTAVGGDWPDALAQVATAWPSPPKDCSADQDLAYLRREIGLKTHWQYVMDKIGAAGAVTQPRADNLWGDGLLPLLVARGDLDLEAAFVWWFAAWPGDQAASLAKVAKVAGIADGRRNPLAWGHVQGILQQQLESGTPGGRGA